MAPAKIRTYCIMDKHNTWPHFLYSDIVIRNRCYLHGLLHSLIETGVSPSIRARTIVQCYTKKITSRSQLIERPYKGRDLFESRITVDKENRLPEWRAGYLGNILRPQPECNLLYCLYWVKSLYRDLMTIV